MHRDYLGSILAITDADGVVREERQFGAWGTVDKFLSSTGNTSFDHSSLLGRGYTGHEHFFEVGLIHMNGRMYDAHLGRFLSPDNYISDPYNTQNYNRYSYVLNGPLMYTDPSGEEPVVIAIVLSVAIIGAAAIFGDWEGASAASNTRENSPPVPGNQNNSEMVSSVSSGQSRSSGGSSGRRSGFEGATATIHSPVNPIPLPQAGIASFNNISSSDSGVYGVSQSGSESSCPDCPPKINLQNPDTDALVDGFVDWANHVRRDDRERVYVSDMLELTRNSGSRVADGLSGFVGFDNQAIRTSGLQPYKGTKIEISTDQHYIKNNEPGSEAVGVHVPPKGIYGSNRSYDIIIVGRRQYGNSTYRSVLRMLVKDKQIRDNIAKRIFRYYRGFDE